MNTPILNPTCANCQRLGRVAGAYADDSVEADQMIAELGLRVLDVEAERDMYRDIAIESLRRTAHLAEICTQQRIALDDRSRKDDNYSQGTEAHKHLEAAIAHREKTNALRFKVPGTMQMPSERAHTAKHGTRKARRRPLPPLRPNLGLAPEART